VKRTKADLFSSKGIFRIYDSRELTEKYSRLLHQEGPWFIEPKDWERFAPWHAGFSTFGEASIAAENLEGTT